jgi:hypothetical protein
MNKPMVITESNAKSAIRFMLPPIIVIVRELTPEVRA